MSVIKCNNIKKGVRLNINNNKFKLLFKNYYDETIKFFNLFLGTGNKVENNSETTISDFFQIYKKLNSNDDIIIDNILIKFKNNINILDTKVLSKFSNIIKDKTLSVYSVNLLNDLNKLFLEPSNKKYDIINLNFIINLLKKSDINKTLYKLYNKLNNGGLINIFGFCNSNKIHQYDSYIIYLYYSILKRYYQNIVKETKLLSDTKIYKTQYSKLNEINILTRCNYCNIFKYLGYINNKDIGNIEGSRKTSMITPTTYITNLCPYNKDLLSSIFYEQIIKNKIYNFTGLSSHEHLWCTKPKNKYLFFINSNRKTKYFIDNFKMEYYDNKLIDIINHNKKPPDIKNLIKKNNYKWCIYLNNYDYNYDYDYNYKLSKFNILHLKEDINKPYIYFLSEFFNTNIINISSNKLDCHFVDKKELQKLINNNIEILFISINNNIKNIDIKKLIKYISFTTNNSHVLDTLL